jgi:HD-GYP domain-containing protein (c-di-GMP phosphodiesterase class II)
MKSKKSYRKSGRFKEILDVLQKAKKSRSNFLWRSQKRQPIAIVINQIHPEENTVDISVVERTGVSLKVGDELYLKLEARDSAFKTIIQSMAATSMILEFPDEIVLSENRIEARQYFHPTDEKIVQLKKIKNYVSSLSERTFSIITADISQTGMALILTPQQSMSLQVNDKVSLEGIGAFRIHPPITGEIVFKIPYEVKGVLGGVEQATKIGVSLSKKIPKATFDRFCVREKTFQISDEQIVRDEGFRNQVHERMGVMVKSLVLKRNLQKLFDRLDMRQLDHQYLKQHIHLLAEVMCGLGTTLGWVSEATMDKLIYVAYLHDARYFSVPKLAKIQSKKEFEKIKKTLTPDEQNVFLEGPIYSSELARQDSESYPDSVKILLQQKELPDGSGFPYGITTSQFLPLSCLFIVSHYFVDYVFSHSDWSVTDFVKTHQKFLKGVYFQKVFQAMRS